MATAPRTWRTLKLPSIGFLLIVMLAGALIFPAPKSTSTDRLAAHPSLLTAAREQPNTLLAVLVQQQVEDPQTRTIITTHGGQITRNLAIVNGFAAQVPAGLIPELSARPSVRWISPDRAIASTDYCPGCYDGNKLASPYPRVVGADQVWNRTPDLRGRGIGVAVIDSGVFNNLDFYLANSVTDRVIASTRTTIDLNPVAYDRYGHGTHVAGIIGGNGTNAGGQFVGIAPEANIINVRVINDQGVATTASVVSGLQWVYDNRARYNIRVVNISLTDSVVESYNTSALDAAVELLWFNNIVVVVAAGNSGDNKLAAPANDPFVITVGATNDRGTADLSDDFIPLFSAAGTTVDGFSKPDLVAPGTNIVSALSPIGILGTLYPQNKVLAANGTAYFRMSGTSMSAPVVAGAAALLLQDEPNLTPDQVKYRLLNTATPFAQKERSGAGYLNIPAAVDGTSTASANTGIPISNMLQDGLNPTVWNSTSWSTAKWSTAKWSTAKWSTAKWSTSN